jgi:urease accessory protein
MTVVDRIHRSSDLPSSTRAYALDTMTLGWEARTHVHGRRTTDGGVEFGTSLPRATVLRDGDCFVLDPERLVVSVIAKPEAVFVVEPRDAQEWGLFAYHIGNRHQPLMITEHALVCPVAPGVAQLLDQHHMPYRPDRQPFTPVATVVGHQH